MGAGEAKEEDSILLDSLDRKAPFSRNFRGFLDLGVPRLPVGAGMPEGKILLETGLNSSSGKDKVSFATGTGFQPVWIALVGKTRSAPGSGSDTNRETQRLSDFGH